MIALKSCASRAIHRTFITCMMPCATPDVKGYSANKFDTAEIAFILPLSYWLKQLTSEGREETGVPGENPDDELQKMQHTKARKFKPQPRFKLSLSHWWQGRTADMLTTTPFASPQYCDMRGVANLFYNFTLSVAAHATVSGYPSLRCTLLRDAKQAVKKQLRQYSMIRAQSSLVVFSYQSSRKVDIKRWYKYDIRRYLWLFLFMEIWQPVQ